MAPGPGSVTFKVLLVDEDAASARCVRSALSPPRFNTVVATRPVDGLRLAAQQQPQIVLWELHFQQGSGFDLARRMISAPATTGIALVFFSQDVSPSARLAALQIGAAGFLSKPCDPTRLVRGIETIISQLQREGLPPDVSALPGARSLVDLLRQAEEGAQSGTIEAVAAGQRARLSLAAGRLLDTMLDGRRGDEAFEALARRGDWQVRFVPSRGTGAMPSPMPSSMPSPMPFPTPSRRPDPSMAPQAAFAGAEEVADEGATVIDQGDVALETVASLITEPDAFRTIEVSTAPEAWRIEHGASAPGGSEVISQGRESDSFSATLPTGTDAMLGFDDDEDEEPTRQAPARFFPIVEDEPAEREVVVPLEMLQGGERLPAGGVDLSSGAASLPAARKAWLGATGNPPLLLVTSEVAARAVFEEAARQEGYEVVTVKTGAEAYASALARRPVAVICDIQLPDADGRELLLGVRCDFRIREVPFIIVAIKDMLPAINAQGVVAVRPVMEGLAQALGPRVDLFAQLRSGRDELQGFGESVGIVHLLNTIAAAKVSGHLSLRAGETRNAEVIFGRGEICGVTVNAPQVVVGPLAMLQLIGLSWQMFGFSLEKGDAGRVSLGRLSEIVEAACVQNNTFLARIYSEGMTIPGVEIDRVALDTYLHEQPAQNYEIMLRLAQGESARALAEEDVAPSGSLKSMLFEVRRCGGLRPLSLRPARGECDVPWTVFSPHVAEASTPPALPETPVSRRRRRWPVVLVACFTTVILAIGGFLVYRYVKVDGQIDKVLPWSGGRSTTSRSGK